MDWFTWLSRTSLDPCHVYEYALTFSQNELEQDDISYFNHEFLQSMGISTAKHRLEILKLARKEKGRASVHPMIWFRFAFKKTRTFLAKHMETLFHRKINSGLYVVPARNSSLRWKVSMVQRNKNLRAVKTEWPTLRCDGSPVVGPGPKMLAITGGDIGPGSCSGSDKSPSPDGMGKNWNGSFSSTLGHSGDGEYWSDEIKWDSMFQNLKPN